MSRKPRNYPVAIVGMHGRFPDAYDVKDFWGNLFEGNDTIRLVPRERWDWEALFGSSAREGESTQINCAAFMPLVDRFDHRFFGIIPREAESMDPQQRLFMQTAYAALEDAGYAPASLAGSNTGVFVGIGNADYPMMMRQDGAAFDIYRATGLALTSIANRVSFSLNVHGPSESIDTACSGSLVAIHHAIRAMQEEECDLAIVGGVNLLVGPDLFIAFDKAGMLSKSARSRTFDAAANGYVRGEGVAAMVLRPLEAAQQNGDYIYAVIHGSAINHGGRAHSFTAPNAAAQAQVIQAAWESSGKLFHQACMIETHGTGTPLGDPIEVNGLKKASEVFATNRRKGKASIALGALKSHVGHMEATAGIGGVIKAVLSMKYGVIPGNLNYSALNPHIDLNNTPYYIPDSNVAMARLRANMTERLAGVSSFGFGGVNGHVVIESYEKAHQSAKKKTTRKKAAHPYLFLLSGRDKHSLRHRIAQLIDFLEIVCDDAVSQVSPEAVLTWLGTELQVDKQAQPVITLAETDCSPAGWMQLVKELGDKFRFPITYQDIEDCLTLQEVAYRASKQARIHRLMPSEEAALRVRVGLPDNEIRRVTAERIAYSLMCGRDTYKERLACIARSKKELLTMLRAYQLSPDTEHARLWTHSIRTEDVAPAKPDVTASPTIDNLGAWAAWWVTSKTAFVRWEDIYPANTVPQKFPLPAYPFRLDRIWYRVSQAQTATQTVTATAPVSLTWMTGLARAWEHYMQSSPWAAPSSIMGLAYLLDYAQYKETSTAPSSAGQIYCRDLQIGRPCSMQDHEVVFASATHREGSLIQCVASRSRRNVVAQAVLQRLPTSLVSPRFPDIPQTQTFSGTQWQAILADLNIGSGIAWSYVSKVHMDAHALNLELELPIWQPKLESFWVPLIASWLAGIGHLCHMRGQPFQIPWKAGSVMFNSAFEKPVNTLHIIWPAGHSHLSLLVFDTSKNLVMSINDIQLRANTIVPMPLHMQSIDSEKRLQVGGAQ